MNARLVCLLQALRDDGHLRRSGLLRHTDADNAVFVTHGVMSKFMRTLDWSLLSAAADYCIGFVEDTLGRGGVRGPMMVIPDYEKGGDSLSHRPYLTAAAGGPEGDRGLEEQQAVSWLCDLIERRGAARWGVDVMSGPYMPLHGMADTTARLSTVSPVFTEKFGASAVAQLIRHSRVLWLHDYQHEDPSPHASHEQRTYTYLRWCAEQIAAAGARPDHVLIVDWAYTRMDPDEMRGRCKGAKRAMAEGWPDAPTSMALAGGGLPMLESLFGARWQDVPVDARSKAIAEAWNRCAEVVAEVFGGTREVVA